MGGPGGGNGDLFQGGMPPVCSSSPKSPIPNISGQPPAPNGGGPPVKKMKGLHVLHRFTLNKKAEYTFITLTKNVP